jgi:hypothetical protein
VKGREAETLSGEINCSGLDRAKHALSAGTKITNQQGSELTLTTGMHHESALDYFSWWPEARPNVPGAIAGAS